jgi:hypothetical protein
MRRHAALIALVTVASGLAGCQRWTPVDRFEDLPSEQGSVRVVTTEGARMTLEDVRLAHDTLYSQERSCSWTLAYGRAPGRAWCGGVAIARADVVRAEVSVGNPAARNVAIVALGFVAGALVIALLELLSDGASAMRRRGGEPATEEAPSRR